MNTSHKGELTTRLYNSLHEQREDDVKTQSEEGHAVMKVATGGVSTSPGELRIASNPQDWEEARKDPPPGTSKGA